AERSVGAPVEHGLQVDSGDRAVALHASLELHQDRMAPAMAVEHFFSRQADLDRPIQQQCGLTHYDLVIEGIGLAAEAAAVGHGHDANMRGPHLERFGERAMYVVRSLRTRPENE